MRLDAFREQRGDDVFAHRSRHRTPISGSVKYGVLTRAKGRCECCNAGKRDTDSTDFRGVQTSAAKCEQGCVFCALEGSIRVLLENELAICIVDAYPVTSGHSLVIPRRHVSDGLELHQPEWNAVVELLPRREGDCEEPRVGCGGLFQVKAVMAR